MRETVLNWMVGRLIGTVFNHRLGNIFLFSPLGIQNIFLKHQSDKYHSSELFCFHCKFVFFS